jgi:hypothetical protein
MAQWIPAPKLDDSAKVGLSFIGIGYGVALVAVFPTVRPETLGLVGWFHLALAAFMLVVSYMGYYSNRQEYPNWCVQFFNVPLLQYIISFGILFLYWELGITQPKPGHKPTPFSAALIVLIIYVAYLAWDCLEVVLQESSKYIGALWDAGRAEMLPPPIGRYTQGIWRRRPVSKGIGWRDRTDERFARDVRARRSITVLFCCLYGVSLGLIWRSHWSGTAAVIIIDSVYIASFFAYRYVQWMWSGVWYHRAGSAGTAAAAMSRPRSSAGLE